MEKSIILREDFIKHFFFDATAKTVQKMLIIYFSRQIKLGSVQRYFLLRKCKSVLKSGHTVKQKLSFSRWLCERDVNTIAIELQE